MSRAASWALILVLALCSGILGAVGAAAAHWYVLQPSDDELRAAAAGVSLPGFRDLDPGRDVSGAWAPSFERGVVHWDSETDELVTIDDVAEDLRGQAWVVDVTHRPTGLGSLHGDDDPFSLTVTLLPGTDARTRASTSVGRAETVPSLRTTVGLGAVVGSAAGVLVGRGSLRWLSVRRPGFRSGRSGAAARRGASGRRWSWPR